MATNEASTDHTSTAPSAPLASLSRRARLILGWGLLLAFVVLFAILAFV
jgi:hypothetical protein